MGDFLGVCRSTYTYYERGTTTPSAPTLYRLSQFYGISPDVFFVPGAVTNLHPDAQRVNGHLKNLEQKSPAQKAAEEKKGRKKPGGEKEGLKKPGKKSE